MEETPKETPLTDHVVEWAAKHGLVIAKEEVLPTWPLIRNGGVVGIDEVNFISPKIMEALHSSIYSIKETTPSRYSLLRNKLYWKSLDLRCWVSDFIYKAKHGFRLPKDMCCWNENMCYDVECKDCGSRDWACAYCGYLPPCVEDACKDKDFA